MALRIDDVGAARRWLARLVPLVSTTREVFEFNSRFRAERRRLGIEPPELAATWVSVALSHGGIAQLASPGEADRCPTARSWPAWVKSAPSSSATPCAA